MNENAIDRKLVCAFIAGLISDDVEREKGLEYIRNMPPVTPQTKTGNWIRVTDKTGHLVWECDKCGWQQRFNTNFCPDCGSHNEGD